MRQNFSLRQCQQQQHALDDDDQNRCSNKDKETNTRSSKTDPQFIMSPFPQRAGCPCTTRHLHLGTTRQVSSLVTPPPSPQVVYSMGYSSIHMFGLSFSFT
mmetsp:Transcript_12655/g.22989  ORF Transcript_12655/g.22989 Transcript_12655/m.22989 type:complete len:101 (-) Transcript_12655:263-565(-)